MATANTGAVILSPDILGQQTCLECHKYLSVGPVVVTRGGRTVCGRCNTNSLYDKVAEKCFFPCGNYSAGCKELLPYNKVKDHEANCNKNAMIRCPFCGYKGNERQLVQHFKQEHSEYVVDNIFGLDFKDGCFKNLIFLEDKHILCVTIIMTGKFFRIYNTLLTPSFSKFTRFTLNFFNFDNDNNFIAFQIGIKHNSKNFLVDTDTIYKEEEGDDNYVQLDNCFLVAYKYLFNCLQSNSYYCRMNYVNHTDQGLEMAKQKLRHLRKYEKPLISKLEPPGIYSEEESLRYINCVLYMDSAILQQLAKHGSVEAPKCSRCKRYYTIYDRFICPKEHIVCVNCIGKECPECGSYRQWNYQPKYHDIILSCEKNCHSKINLFKYSKHLQLCKAMQVGGSNGKLLVRSIHKKYIDYVLKMSTVNLRELVKIRLVEVSQKCSWCNQYRFDQFICSNRHIACEACMGQKCPKCKSSVQRKIMGHYHIIVLSCEWHYCDVNIDILKYREHVSVCKYRLYKCPDKNCQFIGFLHDLKKHWHLDELKTSDRVTVPYKEHSFYWLLQPFQELVYVTFKMTSSRQDLLVTIHEDYALFPESYKFEIPHLDGKCKWVPKENGNGRCQKIILRPKVVQTNRINNGIIESYECIIKMNYDFDIVVY